MKVLFLSAALLAVGDVISAPTASITSVDQNAETRAVAVKYMIDGAEPAVITFDVRTNGVSVGGAALRSVAGDVNRLVCPGSRYFVWMPLAGGFSYAGGNLDVVLQSWATNAPPPFMTVDLVVKSNVLFYASAEAVPFDGGVTSDWCKSQVMVLRRIPAKDKTWRKGSASTSDSNPYEQVTMEEDYYMGVYPVTQNQYEKMGFTNDSSHKGDLLVGWETRADYRPIASATTGYTYVSGTVLPAFSAFSGLDFRLPSAAEWEYACRAGTSTAFNTGVDSVDADISMGWFNANAQGHPRCVGLKSPNGWGLYDMHGNVFEWCSDSIGSDHVLCGGSFLHNSDKCTSTYRAHTQAGSEITGFRLVCPCVAKPL